VILRSATSNRRADQPSLSLRWRSDLRRIAQRRLRLENHLRSGAQLFRVESPATAPKHLVVYCALLDEADNSLLLVDHVKAKCWPLPGGHVDAGEAPRWAAKRETFEELAITAKFHDRFGDGKPFFLTITQTRGAQSHTERPGSPESTRVAGRYVARLDLAGGALRVVPRLPGRPLKSAGRRW
jgi:8-oxo-dGTP pyrophosphatase MutT (NUDIX family)